MLYCKSLNSGSQRVAPIPSQATWELSKKAHPAGQTLWGEPSDLRSKASPPRDTDAHLRAGEFAHLRSNGPWYAARRGWEEKQGQGCPVMLLCDPAQLAVHDPWSSCIYYVFPKFRASSTAWLIQEVPVWTDTQAPLFIDGFPSRFLKSYT